jgi:hypothetical protein
VSVDYATQNLARSDEFAKKPIKNSELSGSGNTCMSVTRHAIARPARARCAVTFMRDVSERVERI